MPESTNLVAELQHYFNYAVVNSQLNKYQIPHPVEITSDNFSYQNSFIRLLFDNATDQTSYIHLVFKNESTTTWPDNVKTRLGIYSNSEYYQFSIDATSDATAIFNLFLLGQEELTMLDALQQYRTDSTSVIMMDSTATLFDSTANILYTTFNNLTTPLSKLIHIFLTFKISGTYTDYNNLNLISTTNILDMAYEAFLIDEIFKDVSSQGI